MKKSKRNAETQQPMSTEEDDRSIAFFELNEVADRAIRAVEAVEYDDEPTPGRGDLADDIGVPRGEALPNEFAEAPVVNVDNLRIHGHEVPDHSAAPSPELLALQAAVERHRALTIKAGRPSRRDVELYKALTESLAQ